MLEELLQQTRSAIVDEWRRRVLDTYPADSVRFLKSEKDRFHNPVGHSISRGLEILASELFSVAEKDDGKILSALDDIIRIRSVQSFTPSEATGFMFLLKDVVREKLAGKIKGDSLYRELLQFERGVDKLALLAFETYMKCREDLFDIKTRALRTGPFKLHERSRKILEGQGDVQTPDTESGPGGEG
jgi:hypothetical protein